MKKLNGHLYLYPAPQTDINALTEYDCECKTYQYISGLLGLSAVPEKWVKVCAFDADCHNESGSLKSGKSDDWCHNGYSVNGFPGILPFPEYLPTEFFIGKRENDILSFQYGDIEVSLVLKQLAYDSYGSRQFEDVFEMVTGIPFEKDVPRLIFEMPQLGGKTSTPKEQKKNMLPAYAPFIIAALGAVGVALIVALGIGGTASGKGA